MVCPPEPAGSGSYFFKSKSLTSAGNIATSPEYIFNWEIQDGIESIYKDNKWEPRPDSLIYQYQNFMLNNDIRTTLTVEYKYPNTDISCWDTVSCKYNITYFNGLFVPNALAPNANSGEPSYFLPKGKSITEYNLQIFNTWGNLVWQTSSLNTLFGSPDIAWEGTTLDGTTLQQGTYLWKIYAKFSNGSIWKGKNGKTTGPIYLIR